MRTTRWFFHAGTVVPAAVLVLAASCRIDGPSGTRPKGIESTVGASEVVAALDAVPCADCIFGPDAFTRTPGAPSEVTIDFTALASSNYVAELEEVGAGANGEVRLNDQTIFGPGRSPNDQTGRREVGVTLATTNTVTVRLVGRPGSGFRLAVRAIKPVTLDAVRFSLSEPVEIDGPGLPFSFTLTNYTKWSRQNIGIATWVLQGPTSRAAGAQPVVCGGDIGELRPGSCTTLGALFPNNSGAGSGTLVPGEAAAQIDVIETGTGGFVVLDSRKLPITLAPTRPRVLEVTVNPSSRLIGVGAMVQLTANVQVVGNAPTTVTWSSSNPAAAVVTSTGGVVAVGAGTATIIATSTADPMKRGYADINVFELRITSPSGPVNVSTGATIPAANPLSIPLVARSCGPSGVYNPFIARVEFYSRVAGTRVTIGSTSVPALTDDGQSRCWTWSIVWTPGTAFGTGPQMVDGVGFGSDGGIVSGIGLISWITTTNP